MAVRADHLALLDLVDEAPQLVAVDHPAHVADLVSEMVDLQHHGVGLAAVGARLGAEVVSDQLARRRDPPLRPCPDLGPDTDTFCLVKCVVALAAMDHAALSATGLD